LCSAVAPLPASGYTTNAKTIKDYRPNASYMPLFSLSSSSILLPYVIIPIYTIKRLFALIEALKSNPRRTGEEAQGKKKIYPVHSWGLCPHTPYSGGDKSPRTPLGTALIGNG